MREQEVRNLWEAYLEVCENQQLDEALTGKRLQRAKEIIARDPKSPTADAVKRVADSQEGSNRNDTTPGDLPRDRSNTTLPTGKGGRGRKGLGKTTNRPGRGAPLGGRTPESDRGRGNRARRRAGGDVEDTRYDESFNLFDAILEHLVSEGYADTNESALAIMANMSDEWRQSIVEAIDIPRPRPTKYIAPSRPLPAPAATTPKPDMSTPKDKEIGRRISQTPIGMRLTGPTGPLR